MSTSDQSKASTDTSPTQVTPETIETIPVHTVAEATIAGQDDISITTTNQTPITEYVTERVEKRISNEDSHSDTTTYAVTGFPAKLAVSVHDLMGINGVERITVTVEKQDTEHTLEKIQAQLRRIVTERLLSEDAEFRSQYERAQRNPIKRILAVFFNRNVIPSRMPFEQLPAHLQERINREINERRSDNGKVKELVMLRERLADEETDADIFDMHMELTVENTHTTDATEALHEHRIDIIEQDNMFEDTTFKVNRGVPKQLLTEVAETR